ncbi:hypothetical protein Agabi119p4_5539 [Agaricus bisporus var. burnettii]|uniref:Uncharacterized protein n=1 Tax=Agaricus bisporus var. burnettii TaxID=192524 RepID=A0A8H7F1V8_AGABI|nr:hypothetical protein Agabi119p4_5539 [Agaricus bisporus var. burnettii]
MTATLGPVPRFADENSARHSFSLPPPPPSLDASSMKSRKSFLDLFAPTRRFASAKADVRSGSKLKVETAPTENATTTNSNKASSRADPRKEPLGERKPDRPEVPSKDLPRSKSHTLLRAISTTFRTRPAVQPASPSPVSPTLQAKQNREAALRERGLLPPLAPPKDLSRQEADQDRRTPVVRFESKNDGNTVEPSAADLVKREWESKNQSKDPEPSGENEERERMRSFRFGAPSPQATESPVAHDLVAPVKVKSDPNPPQPLMKNLPQRPSIPQSSGFSDGPSVDAASVPFSSSLQSVSSPTHSAITGRKSSSISSANNLPPSSFHYTQHAETELSSSSSGHSRSGSRRSFASATPLSLPSPQIVVPGESSYPSLNISIPSRRSESLSQLHSISESTSPVTPSLDSSSRTVTTISTLNTAESPSLLSSVTASRAKGKMGMLKVKTSEHVANIPMIVESPGENSVAVKSQSELRLLPPLSPDTAKRPSTLVIPQETVLTRRAREPLGSDKVDKRKSFNPFKRSQSVGPADCNRTGDSKRSSISAIDKLRRASSSFTKPRASHNCASTAPSKGKTLDVSHLPPSPALPTRFQTAPCVAARPSGDGRTTGVGQRPQARKPLDPTVHSRGSILLETSAIKDEESRRMTEMAFLG